MNNIMSLPEAVAGRTGLAAGCGEFDPAGGRPQHPLLQDQGQGTVDLRMTVQLQSFNREVRALPTSKPASSA